MIKCVIDNGIDNIVMTCETQSKSLSIHKRHTNEVKCDR